MATWAELDAELTLWAGAGEVPTFWWRDDDCEAQTNDLDRLIALAEQFAAPLHLAVVPADIDVGLAGRMTASPHVYALQHGFAHINHEPKGTGASEVGVLRDLLLQEADLREGWQRMISAKLPNLLPVFVPPWNRIADKTVQILPKLGYTVLSDFYRRPDLSPVEGLMYFNAHIDPIRWKEGAKFAGTEKTLEQCVVHLRQRRTGEADKAEPTCFCTHHLQTDEATWDFSAELMAQLTHRQRTSWAALPELIKSQGAT
jgi:hypothetical protein